jgi:hypothetical protein
VIAGLVLIKAPARVLFLVMVVAAAGAGGTAAAVGGGVAGQMRTIV